MAATSVKIVDSLSLLSLKVAPNVFDLSSGMHHVSIRDQIVRAQLVVRDLARADRNLENLMIVGAGVAGLSAALYAAEQGICNVVVLEAGNEPFSLFKGVTNRHVGPFMYEWPNSFYNDQSYPSHDRTPWTAFANSPFVWSSKHPCSADQLAKLLTQALKDRLAALPPNLRPLIFVNVPKAKIRNDIRAFASAEGARHQARLQGHALPLPHAVDLQDEQTWPSSTATATPLFPQYVLLAGGMGQEDLSLVKKDAGDTPYTGGNPVPRVDCPSFWANDRLLEAATCNHRVAVFGGGDGALQDVLRALTGRAHPLQLLHELQRVASVKRLLMSVSADLHALDRQGRQFATWTTRNHEFEGLDWACRGIAERLARNPRVIRRVGQLLRHGTGHVTLIVRESYFDKAYLLNRFMVHLFWACARQRPSSWAGRMQMDVRFRSRACSYQPQSTGHAIEILDMAKARVSTVLADQLAVRYGIEPGTVPGAQLIQVSRAKSEYRTTMARVELPLIVEQH